MYRQYNSHRDSALHGHGLVTGSPAYWLQGNFIQSILAHQLQTLGQFPYNSCGTAEWPIGGLGPGRHDLQFLFDICDIP